MEGIDFALNHGEEVNARISAGQTVLIFALKRAKGLTHRQGLAVTPDAVRHLIKADPGITDQASTGAEKWLKTPIFIRELKEKL